MVKEYQQDGSPIIVTEWLVRARGSTVEKCLIVKKKLNTGTVNWGFVSGKSGTHWPWESRRGPDNNPLNIKSKREAGEVIQPGEPFPEPEIWFQDLFRNDGTPSSDEHVVNIPELHLDDFPAINCYYFFEGSWSELYLDYESDTQFVLAYALIEEQKVIFYKLNGLQYKIVLVI